MNKAAEQPTPRVGVIALVPDRWRGIWMVRHQVLRRMARHFDVVWVEPPLSWRNYWLSGGSSSVIQNMPADEPGFTLYDPGRWLPQVYRPRWLHARLRHRRVAGARRVLERKGCTQIVLYLWRPEFDWAIEAANPDLTCYHIDDEYQFSTVDKPNDPREVALIRASDLVIIHSRKLLEMKAHLNPNTVYVPNGVDYAAYSIPAPEPKDLAAIPHPRMGYIGVVKTQLDFAMLEGIARRRPQWSFVIVGPRGYLGEKAAALERFSRLPNVHVLGNRQIGELPAYTQYMDVCMMCYDRHDFTNYHIYPLKMHEYLASGRPTVSAPIDAVLPYDGILKVATTDADWEQALAAGLEPQENSPTAVAARQALAAEYDWERLVDRIAGYFRRRLAGESVRDIDMSFATAARPRGTFSP